MQTQADPAAEARRKAAERAARYRARRGAPVSVLLPLDLKAELDAYLARQRMDVNPDLTMSQVIERLIRSQLLRKR